MLVAFAFFGVPFLLLVFALDLVGRVVGGDRHLGRATAGLLHDIFHPVVELVAGLEDHLRARRRLDVIRAGLVVVRVGIGLQQLVELSRVAGDIADDVPKLCRGDDDQWALCPLVLRRCAGVILPAASRQQQGDGQCE